MLSKVINKEFGEFWEAMVANVNVGKIKGDIPISYKIYATMMSGEQTTGLFNLILNWLIFEFAKDTLNIAGNGFMEGDDGIFSLSLPVGAQMV